MRLPRSQLVRALPIAAVVVLLVAPLIVRPERLELGPRRLNRILKTRVHAMGAGWFDLMARDRRRAGSSRRDVDLSAYRDLGSWIDIYNHWPWKNPVLAIRKLHERGVKTVFLQTSNYGADRAIFRPWTVGRLLRAAHRRDMKVVGWYVPSFAHPRLDLYRSKAAIRFRGRGHSFDSFALDIEATVVGNIWRRNRRLLELSRGLRGFAGPDYALGAITPDPVKALYWPDFPYKKVRRLYDVFVPMGYFSFRTDGYRRVKRYTIAGVRAIRRASGDPKVPIHFIGGIGGDTQAPEVKGFVRAAKGTRLLGASYYDFSATTEEEWDELEAFARAEPDEKADRTRNSALPDKAQSSFSWPQRAVVPKATPVAKPSKPNTGEARTSGRKATDRRKRGRDRKRDRDRRLRRDRRDGRKRSRN